MRCSQTQGRTKRKIDEDQGGSATKKPKRADDRTEGPGLEERKVRALERIAAQLERVGDRLERMGGEARRGSTTTSRPLSTCRIRSLRASTGRTGTGSPSSPLRAGSWT